MPDRPPPQLSPNTAPAHRDAPRGGGEPYILFSTGSPARYMLPPQFSERQVVCGPDWPDDRSADGRVRSLQTAAGAHDLAAIAAKLPPEQQPEAVVCLVDASWRNLPRNLAAFKCPRVLLVADTHHLKSPLIGMMRYVAAEPFDRIVFLYDRHHAGFFAAAGFRHLFWFPGLTLPHTDAAVAAARRAQREPRIAFVGQASQLHPRRARMLGALAACGLPVATARLPQRDALGFYGASQLAFNASLNGDLNLRVFEALASGAALLTDRLAPEAGLEVLLTDGQELATYGDSAELGELAHHYLSRPGEAAALGAAGARWFDRHLHAARRRAMFRELVFDGRAPPGFELGLAQRGRTYFGGNLDRLLQGLIVYEGVQELHRTQESVRVLFDPESAPEDFAAICATLPRVQLSPAAEEGEAHLAVLGRHRVGEFAWQDAPRVWCWDAPPEESKALSLAFARHGFIPASLDVAVYARPETLRAAQPAAPASAADQVAQARALFRQGDLNGALALGRAALEVDPRSIEARVLLGELALARQRAPLAEKLFAQAAALRPGDFALQTLLAAALVAQQKLAAAGDVLARVLKVQPQFLPAQLALARLRLAEHQPAAAEAALREAVRRHPGVPEAARELGDFLKRHGRVLEALDWHRRALGCSDEVRRVDPTTGPVRVAFLVQHPQGWTSLESVWRTMQGDTAFETTIIAAPYQHPYPTEGGPDAIFGFLEKAGVPFVPWTEVPLRPGFADIVFVQNPYDVTRPPPLHVPALLKLVPRLAYVPYGIEIGGGERNATMQHDQPLQQLAWAVFARSARHKAMFARHCRTGDAHVTVTGHPKMDAVRDLAQLPPDEEFARVARGRKIVFWNPQFDLKPDGTGYSTFLIWETFLLAEFARRQDLAFVIRPHPLFFGTLEKRGLWNADQVADFLARVERAGNVLIDRRASYLPVFAASAAMLSDASSFLLEYAATGKPLLYLHNPRGPQLNADGEFVGAHCATAATEADIAAFLTAVATADDPLAAERMAAYAEFMHRPPAGAGAAIRDAIKARLEDELGTARECARRRREAGREFWRNCRNTYLAPAAYYAKAAAALAALLPRCVRRSDRVIDFGCGNGEMTLLAAAHCTTVRGYDVSPALIAQAQDAARRQRVTNATFHVLDLERGTPEAEAEVVLCLGVFACIADNAVWHATLARFARMLPTDGVLVLRETVSAGAPRTVEHPSGYVATYRPIADYVAAVTERGFAEAGRVTLFREPDGLENHLWIFRRRATAGAAPITTPCAARAA
jgi:tetratricopeptide (TPR) repeat protein/2-polyprenyl-3-methyl-5-hydroxy-6-metoxy-1,4-benzoquinol methylase